jgi:hypothetical protein
MMQVTDLQAGVEDVTADMMTFQPPSDETAGADPILQNS